MVGCWKASRHGGGKAWPMSRFAHFVRVNVSNIGANALCFERFVCVLSFVRHYRSTLIYAPPQTTVSLSRATNVHWIRTNMILLRDHYEK